VPPETDFASAIDTYRKQSINWTHSAEAFVMHANAAAELGNSYATANKEFADSRNKLAEMCPANGNATSPWETTNGATGDKKPTDGDNPPTYEMKKQRLDIELFRIVYRCPRFLIP